MERARILFFILFVLFVLLAKSSSSQTTLVFQPDSIKASRWADSVLKTLTVKEKFGQMLTIRVYSNKNENEYAAVDKLIEDCHVGGVLFFQGTIEQQAKLTERWQKRSKIPLFVSIDGETGLGMRLSDAARFPMAATMGAVADDDLIFKVGEEIGIQCRKLGVHINYAPVADININSKNPVIGMRSFGEKTGNVARKASAFAKGMQSIGVIAVAKHFPGHGDTETDSHRALPVINHPVERLEKIEMYPFKYLINQGISGVMLGHLNIPSLDTLEKPSSLSSEVGVKLLQNELGFKGLIMTDGLDMKGVTSYAKPGEIEVEAFLAGNDILLIPPKPRAALDSLMSAYENEMITEQELDERCRKILFHKALYGANRFESIQQEDIDYLLNFDRDVIKNIYNAASTVLNNNDAIPLNLRAIDKTLIITYGKDKGNFEESMRNHAPFRFISYENFVENEKLADSIEVVVAAVFAGDRDENSYGINQKYVNHIKIISQKKKVVLALYANPYSLRLFDFSTLQAIVMGYENQPYATASIPNILSGSIPGQGILPISTGDFKAGDGENMENRYNLCYASSDDFYVNPKYIKQIDSLAQLGIDKNAYPGCQILLAKDGKVFYHKSFGYTSNELKTTVSNDCIYDVASLTKILATTPAVMKLSEQGKINIDRTLGHYLKFLKDTDKEDIVIRDILAHQSGLIAWIPFYTKINDTLDVYSLKKTDEYTIQIADNMYMRPEYQDTIFQMIASSQLKSRKYVYSDLGMILLAEIVAQQSDMKFDEFLEKEIYQKMNLGTIGFNPLNKFSKNVIVPTEQDDKWRKQLIQGYVHDMAAAMFGGVTGNAGLFANAWDVGAMMQMFLQNGFYNDQHIIKNNLVHEYAKQQFPLNDNRRGLGFDKPSKTASKSPVCASASKSSFGHSGFTGCFAWADPANGLVYVFLSNRIHPSSENNTITKMGIRSLIHEAAYNAIKPVK
ncbi:MAG: serine hydrolase [Bacteroidales bacterium]|nr:serine hydrolase [Bacteroidales bacterium]